MRVKPDQPARQDLGDLGEAFVWGHVVGVERVVGGGEAYGHGTETVGDVILAAGRYC